MGHQYIIETIVQGEYRLQSRYLIVENFFDKAEELRSLFDRHFSTPYERTGGSHQIWDYWHVPELYTYLKTDLKRVISASLIDLFLERLRTWSTETLGLTDISPANLSLYVNGCGQGLHNDVRNGRWGYVYSITRWDERKFVGGETLIFKDVNYWETERSKRSGAGRNFYDLVPAKFNQLLVFDDRLIHAVPQIQGNMNPQDGRVVLHGHIREGGIDVKGYLTKGEVEQVCTTIMPDLNTRISNEFGTGLHGCIALRLMVAMDGSVENIHVLNDRVLRTSPKANEPEYLLQMILTFLKGIRFPSSSGKTSVTLPIPIDG
jgi:hypothetical protein